jgi:hypothetical protein
MCVVWLVQNTTVALAYSYLQTHNKKVQKYRIDLSF